ncbi:NmrA domain-containing protein [Mycena venus]|uniref:NmrA domain-containing protein n=1 Tax=Mycena venus TaxID=2733690 RepID=A0A8H6WXD1_9AGAR|nr:NmrA domain-containing protein [Mycena venus]
MSTYKSFAVVGAGTVGLPIVNALAAANATVIVLSRPGSSPKTLPSGVQVVQVDFSDVTAVAAVFKEHKVDVVLSPVTTTAAAAQKPLVDAAKLAAVKLFVPSEYGLPTAGLTEGPLAVKDEIARYLKSVGIPSTRIFTGPFTEFIPWIADYSAGGKFKVVGKGDAPISFTSIPDISEFVAHVLTTLPPSELEDKILRLEGDRASLNELAALFKTTVEYVDSIEGQAGVFQTSLQKLIEAGYGSTGWDGGTEGGGNGEQCGRECKRVVARAPVEEHQGGAQALIQHVVDILSRKGSTTSSLFRVPFPSPTAIWTIAILYIMLHIAISAVLGMWFVVEFFKMNFLKVEKEHASSQDFTFPKPTDFNFPFSPFSIGAFTIAFVQVSTLFSAWLLIEVIKVRKFQETAKGHVSSRDLAKFMQFELPLLLSFWAGVIKKQSFYEKALDVTAATIAFLPRPVLPFFTILWGIALVFASFDVATAILSGVCFLIKLTVKATR